MRRKLTRLLLPRSLKRLLFALLDTGQFQVVKVGLILDAYQHTVHLVFLTDEMPMPLAEAQHRGFPIGGTYTAQLHKAHTPQSQDHLHIYSKKNQLLALNKDGSAHDRSHGTRTPNKVADALRQHYPDFVLPPDNIIESAPTEIDTAYQALLEETTAVQPPPRKQKERNRSRLRLPSAYESYRARRQNS